MKEIPLKIFGAEVIITLVLLVMIIFFNQSERYEKYNGNIQDFKNGWSYDNGSEILPIKEGTQKVEWTAGKTLTLYNKIPENIKEGNAIAFFTVHENVEVYADNSLIYSFKTLENSFVKSPGNAWNIVSIPRMYFGKELKICITTNYPSDAGILPEFKMGTKNLLINDILNRNLLTLIIASTIMMSGIVLLGVYFALRKVYEWDESVLYVGVLALLMGIWSVIETQILPIYLGHNFAFSQAAFLSLVLMPYTFMRFFRLTYAVENYRFQKVAATIVQILTATVFILAIFRIADFKETLFLIHFSMGISFVVMTCGIIMKMRTFDREQRRLGKFHLICLFVMCLSLGFYFLDYYLGDKQMSTFIIAPVAMLTILLTNMKIRNTLWLARVGKEAEQIEKIAYHDVLTNLENRAAYTKKVNSIPKEEYAKYGIVMMDLNNLKGFNDVYGHSMGDYYIIICSEIMYDIFDSYGSIYRIGGDEFCALIKDCDMATYNVLGMEVKKKLEKLKVPNTQMQMGISIGYAKFDSDIDKNLFDTMNRADELMYDNKQKLKVNGYYKE
ncbi:GGDEF domain-containing protein [Anaerosacchariphilus polymeriproducens]|nr:GGDEF domain-containing protein [Anaerosacchariphilus polymeriproducens]